MGELIKILVAITYLNESREQLEEIKMQLKEQFNDYKFYYSDGMTSKILRQNNIDMIIVKLYNLL